MRTAVRYGVAIIFIASGIAKLWEFSATAFLFSQTTGAPERAMQAGLTALIAIELLLAAGLVLADARARWIDRIAFAVIGLLTLASAALWMTGAENCGCFGTLIAISPAATVAKNIVLLAAAGWLVFARNGDTGRRGGGARPWRLRAAQPASESTSLGGR